MGAQDLRIDEVPYVTDGVREVHPAHHPIYIISQGTVRDEKGMIHTWSRQPTGVEYWLLVDFDPPQTSLTLFAARWGQPFRRTFQGSGAQFQRWLEQGLRVDYQYRRTLVLYR